MKNEIGRNNKIANLSFAMIVVGFPLAVLMSMYDDKPYFDSFILAISSFSVLGYLIFYGRRYLSLLTRVRTSQGLNFAAFVALISLSFVTAVFHVATGSESLLLQGVASGASGVVMIYFYLTMMDLDFGSSSVRLTMVVSMFLMFAIAILGFVDTGFWFSTWRFPYNYLSLLAVLVLFLSFENPFGSRPAYYVFVAVSIFCLISLGGRSELLVLLCSVLVMKMLNIKFMLGLSLAVGFWWAFFFESTLNIVADNSEQVRVFGSLLQGLDGDESLNDRRTIFDERLLSINESPLLGSYGDYESGRYAHNLFSVWDDYGLVGLLLFLVILFSYGLRVVSTSSVAMATAFVFCIFQWALFKAHFYPLGWALVGLSFNQYIARGSNDHA